MRKGGKGVAEEKLKSLQDKFYFHIKLRIVSFFLGPGWKINVLNSKILKFHLKLESYFQSCLFISKINVIIKAMQYLG